MGDDRAAWDRSLIYCVWRDAVGSRDRLSPVSGHGYRNRNHVRARDSARGMERPDHESAGRLGKWPDESASVQSTPCFELRLGLFAVAVFLSTCRHHDLADAD